MNEGITAYKKCVYFERRYNKDFDDLSFRYGTCIVQLYIPEDARLIEIEPFDNGLRPYCSDRAIVRHIYKKVDEKYAEGAGSYRIRDNLIAASPFILDQAAYSNRSDSKQLFWYKPGETTFPDYFGLGPNELSMHGIYFFKTTKDAYLYEMRYAESGEILNNLHRVFEKDICKSYSKRNLVYQINEQLGIEQPKVSFIDKIKLIFS